jgi:alpha-L-glutamate ligase-like protein
MRCNPRSFFPLVDDKVLTKKLAESFQIPTPTLYYVVDQYGDVAGFQEALRDIRQFAVKPARGSGGSGIVLIRDCTEKGYVTQSGELISPQNLFYHISDILSGIYSLSGLEDRAILEALIHPDPVFDAISYQGVPDVRIVVYRGVPVMAMVRLPTKASDGKANLHRGAIGAGIELNKGITITAVHRSRVVSNHPDTGNPVSGIQVPYWEKMLWIAARSFDMTGLGYIGVDLVIDRDRGPLLLEFNARPGLAIQLANRKGLKERLDKIDQAPPEVFASAEARVRWAQENFA